MVQSFDVANLFTDEQAEAELLAAIRQDPETYWHICDITPESVWAFHRAAFHEIQTAITEGQPIPGGDDATTPAAEPVEVAHHLANLYKKRMTADLLQNAFSQLHQATPADRLLTDLEHGATEISQSIRDLQAGQTVAVPDLFDSLLADVDKRYQAVKEQGRATVGIPTAFPRLDKMLGGLQKGIHLLAAEPGAGKTTFALQVARQAAVMGHPVLFVTFEESPDRLVLKMLCSAAGLNLKRFTDGYGQADELRPAIRDHGASLARVHLVEGTSKTSVQQVKAKALQVMQRSGADQCLVIVDYLQRWASTTAEHFNDFRHTVSGLVSDLRELSMRLNSPVLVISSQNRGGQGSGSLTSLKESGDLEYSADSALFLTKDDKRPVNGTDRAITLELRKNRYGDQGQVEMLFKPERGHFAEVAR